jgi:hypothetical protein
MPGRIAVATLLMLLALAGTASAQDEPPPPDVGDETEFEVGKPAVDEQYTHFTVPFRCARPAFGTPSCDVTVTARFQRLGRYPQFRPAGGEQEAGSARVAVPAGAQQDVELETRRIIASIARTQGGNVRVTLEVRVADASFAPKLQLGGGFPTGCGNAGDPYLVPWSGAGRPLVLHDHGPSQPVRTEHVIPGQTYGVRGGPIVLAYNGIRVTVAEGSRFTLTCVGQTEVARGRLLLTPLLHSGRMDVRTSASMDQPAAYVFTREGNLGTRRREASEFTVQRDGGKRISTLAVEQGRSGAITPNTTKERSPCTAGERLSVDRRGRIRER